MSRKDESAKARKLRNHSASQLKDRPVTFETCSGPLTVQTREDGAKITVVILHPDGLTVIQPPAKAK
jgi:hypothetical protein